MKRRLISEQKKAVEKKRKNKMEQNKKELFFEQTNKISEVISTLSENFSQEDVADEINILSAVRDNLKDWAEKGGLDA